MDEAARKRRLFIALGLDNATRSRCAAVAEELRRTGFEARYESADKYHVTLAFLGNVTPVQVEPIAAAMQAAAASLPGFTILLDKLGGFPHERRPRVVVIGARAQGAAFRELARTLRETYEALGFSFKTDAVAHVTIARVKAPRRALPSVEFAPISLDVSALSLFESLPSAQHNTSRYLTCRSAKLAVA